MELEKFLVGRETNAFQSTKSVIVFMTVQTGAMKRYMNVLHSLIKFSALHIPQLHPTFIQGRIRTLTLTGTKWTITLQALITILLITNLEILDLMYHTRQIITIQAVNFNRHLVNTKIPTSFFSHLT